MKSKRRHELQHNVLDAELGKIVGFFRKRGMQVAWGVLIAVLIVFVVFYVRGKWRRDRDQVVADYNHAVLSLDTLDAEGNDEIVAMFKELAEQDKNERVAAMACVHVGDVYTARMISPDPTRRHSEPRTPAEEAATWYRRAVEEHRDEHLAVAKAHVGLARLAESKRDFDTARSEYQAAAQAATKMPGGSGQLVTTEADLGIKRLDFISAPISMATTLPATPETAPATGPASRPATQPDTQPATSPATLPATREKPA